jgi:putative membrane protein
MNNRIKLYLKGIAMGAADVVPGVSGGTIAFISGIYDELLNSINSINLKAFKVLFKNGLLAFWKHINANFLLVLLLGIITAIFTLSKLITYLLDNYPVYVWAFFFGLIAASIIYVAKQIKYWSISVLVFLLLGTSIAWLITRTGIAIENTQTWYIFICGCVAICAMILPGISGSFILVLMGTYNYILTSVKEFKIMVIAVFASGCIIGLLSFSRLLSFLLNKFQVFTIALLTGFLVGSLNKIWPWKETLQTFTDSKGKIIPILEKNVLPADISEILLALITAVAGFLLIFIVEKIAVNKTTDA